MGFFSKQKITIDQLGESLAGMVLKSGLEEALVPLFKDMKESLIMNANQKRELLAFEMLSTTLGIQRAFGQLLGAREVLDAFHSHVYMGISRFKHEQTEFEKFLNGRYGTYYEILSMAQDNKIFFLGKQFADLLLNRDVRGDGLALIVACGDIFTKKVELQEKFLRETLSKFELVSV